MAMGVSFCPLARGETALPASTTSSDQSTPLYFSLPAPRGQILDARGVALARNTTVRRLMLQVPPLNNETPELFCEWVKAQWPEVLNRHPDAVRPTDEFLTEHFQHRRLLPIAISSTKAMDAAAGSEVAPLSCLSWRAEYQRDYPNAEAAAHVVGYVAPAGPVANGPLHHGEPLWRPVEGREGLEKELDKELAGQPGLLMMSFDHKTLLWEEKVILAPQPGNDVVTTLGLPTQKSAEKALLESKRAGALVIVNASNGDVLAMASAPTFNPAIFASGMMQDEFDQFTSQPSQPLHHRAVASLYPPGSVFKPFVALGILRAGAVPADTRILCGPELEIDGRKFGNWSDSDYGMFDLRAAMVRSCNTYFYQAAIASGAKPIADVARQFGFGSRPTFPLPNLAGGTLPSKISNRQALANFSIGQGDVLVCPLQVAVAMAALANDGGRPHPRLVSQVQSQNRDIVSITTVKAMGVLDASPEDLESIRKGMYGVVNHQQGTATKARQKDLPIYGKTGTAQWSNQGKKANVVWFGGFVMHSTPPIAFVVALEGKSGETISGGQTAAPVMAKVLADIAASPSDHGIKIEKIEAPFQDDPLINDPAMIPVLAGQVGVPTVQPASLSASPDASILSSSPVMAAPAPAPVLKLSEVSAPSSGEIGSNQSPVETISDNKPVVKKVMVFPGQNPEPPPDTRSVAALPVEIEVRRKTPDQADVVVVPKAEAVEPQPPIVEAPVAIAVESPPPSSGSREPPKALPVIDTPPAMEPPEAPAPAKTKRRGFLFFGNGDDDGE